MARQSNKEIVQRFFRVMDAGDFSQTAKLLAPNFRALVMGQPEPLDPQSFHQFTIPFYSAFPDGHHDFSAILADGDLVSTFGAFKGTHRGPFMGLAPTGKTFSMSVAHVDRVVDGKILEHRGFGDLHGLLRQLT